MRPAGGRRWACDEVFRWGGSRLTLSQPRRSVECILDRPHRKSWKGIRMTQPAEVTLTVERDMAATRQQVWMTLPTLDVLAAGGRQHPHASRRPDLAGPP